MINTNKKTTNKIAYLLSVEDPSNAKKIRFFVCLSAPDVSNLTYVNIRGIELSKAQLEDITNYEQLEELAKNSDTIDIIIPWQRIINIKNISNLTK